MAIPIAEAHLHRSEHYQTSSVRQPQRLSCSVGIMAYNEEANIARTLQAVLAQQSITLDIHEIIIVASGCTDRTIPIVRDVAAHESRVKLYIQEQREGKASAINLFLAHVESEVVVLLGGDTIPAPGALEHLCAPLLDTHIGMVGGRPIPVNNPRTFMGHVVHLLWHLHDRLAEQAPKLGEVVAFRNVVAGIPIRSAVDEISLQALISQLGYQLYYEPYCVVYNKGPLTIKDFLRQRRRIYAGHLQVKEQQHYEASTMRALPIIRQLLATHRYALSTPRKALWTLGAVVLESYARLQGYLDYLYHREHHIWQTIHSTKDLDMDLPPPIW
ncbi:hypothetical protein KSD_34140 [Ktedonobacter sp. SOSP1-85]|uniref:glycosyltransferase n=1 Tax=Ktedonobacter sp. SOSP1-85 TaxID=2778367 RepID=UPI0019161927|nr:glycosyltransferase [Ktedonobacter sp. SOSP1-85]GHO75643.1 hypothetical protein KSD_34140 [Ktedonobacter sp. SOSP1-85]